LHGTALQCGIRIRTYPAIDLPFHQDVVHSRLNTYIPVY